MEGQIQLQAVRFGAAALLRVPWGPGVRLAPACHFPEQRGREQVRRRQRERRPPIDRWRNAGRGKVSWQDRPPYKLHWAL